ncbi:hypothetical protein NDU88_001874 [Pleurodeles waltl]|uniref:Secreted protein n=1 Tax=Pleurodeles waltl TaxID=8319 RepID=A0AAV7RAB7_PLEWA|nr:hypothetical protein NDU88_001874 [Pleurodeles waltl]
MSCVCAWIFLLVFRLRVVLRGCVSKLRSHGRRRFLLWRSGGVVLAKPCVGFPVAPKALRQSASVCSVFLAAEQAVRRNLGARSVQVKKRSLFGPVTSGNRRQALSKPLESTFTARQEFSKAAVQQQGSSPL